MGKYNAEQIVELEFLEAVRLRPGMYIGNNNIHGLHHLLLEVESPLDPRDRQLVWCQRVGGGAS